MTGTSEYFSFFWEYSPINMTTNKEKWRVTLQKILEDVEMKDKFPKQI